MGREARCACRCGAEAGEVKVLLETEEVILCGTMKRRIPIASITDIRVAGEALHSTAGVEAVVLELRGAEAGRWAAKLATPPPSLRQKLGVGPDCLAIVVGKIDGTPLAMALEGVCAEAQAAARVMVAVVEYEADLRAATAQLPPGMAIWVVYGKGRRAAFGENAVRAVMRGDGFIDTKIAAVSTDLSAMRYIRR